MNTFFHLEKVAKKVISWAKSLEVTYDDDSHHGPCCDSGCVDHNCVGSNPNNLANHGGWNYGNRH